MNILKKISLWFNVFLFLAAVFCQAFTVLASNDSSFKISAWVAYWDQDNGAKSLPHYIQNLDTISLFNYAFNEKGNLIENENLLNENSSIGAVIKNRGKAKIVATLVNDIIPGKGEKAILKDPQKIHEILKNPEKRKSHIREIMTLAQKNNFDGIDIDYENLFYKDRAPFSVFIKELAESLHAKGKILAVTVQQKTQEKKSNGAGAMDWAELGRHADEIRIMCYNFSSMVSQPGPLAPPYWVEDIIKFAKSQIPEEKISIALGLQGFDWSKDKVQSITYLQALERAKIHKAKIVWDKKSSTPHFEYLNGMEKHEVWIENKASLSEKLKILKKNKIRKLAIWRLGQEDSKTSELLKN